MVDVMEVGMLKLKQGFECQNAGWIRYIVPTGGGFKDRIASWGGRDAFFIMQEKLIAHCEFARGATPEDAHRLIVEHGPAYGVESPWEVVADEGEEEKARRVVDALTRAASEGVIDAPERDYALPPVNEPVANHAALQLRAAALQKQVDLLRKEEFRLTIKNHKASAMIARLKRANDARPKSPAYYNQGVDCADIVNAYNLSYWDGGAVCHILRAGNKPGESRLQALENALACLRHSIAVERAK